MNGMLGDRPKAFLPFRDSTFVQRAVSQLNELGIRKVIIVTGFGEQHFATLTWPAGTEVEFVFNADYQTRGTIHSLLLGLSRIQSDTIVMDADIIFERAALRSLAESASPNSIVLTPTLGTGDEYFAWISDDEKVERRLTWLSKQADASRGKPFLEHIGIVKLGVHLWQALVQHAQNSPPAGANSYYEQYLSELLSRHYVEPLILNDLVWTEVDDANMWQRAQEHIFPRLRD